MNSADNSADCATRPNLATNLVESVWIHGPKQISDSTDSQDGFLLVSPEQDKEVRRRSVPLTQVSVQELA